MPAPIDPPTLLLPHGGLFSARAVRLRERSRGHSLGAWLGWLADLCDRQQALADALVQTATPYAATPSQPFLAAQTPALFALARTQVRRLADLLARTDSRFDEAIGEDTLDATLREELACANGQGPAREWTPWHAVAAAALQVVWSHAASHLVMPGESVVAVSPGGCPCCGAAPVGSIILAGEGKAGLRYQECSLCASRWHVVRARCTLCTSDDAVSYLCLEGHHDAVQAEICTHCHGYTKVFSQLRDLHVDPTADDLATLALDVLVGEQGFGRGAPNLLLGEGEAIRERVPDL